MNAKEIAKHTTALDDLAAAMEEFVEATESRIVKMEREMRESFRDERNWHVAVCEKEHSLLVERIDREVKLLRAAYEESRQFHDSEIHSVDANVRLVKVQVNSVLNRSFLQRLKWVFFGE